MYTVFDENIENIFSKITAKTVYLSMYSWSNGSMNNELRQKLTDQILDQLSKAGPKGESISFLRSVLRDNGWKGLGTSGRFEDLIEDLGFTLVRECKTNGIVLRTYVTV